MLNEINNNKLLEIFTTLVQIPSPSLSEDKVIKWIQDFCKKDGIPCELDDYGNVFIKIDAKAANNKPIALSAHMDVVGDSSPINLKVEGDFIKTDGKRTLGADDKAGVACALMLASELATAPSPLATLPKERLSIVPERVGWSEGFEHGGLEIVFTRDEEHGMSGIKHIDFKKLQSKYILVLDADKLGQLQVSGASYTNARLIITTPLGGHSGIDIADKNRLNAAKLISELTSNIPQGVFYQDDTGVITSINLGTIIAGNIQNIATKIVDEKIKNGNYLDYFMDNSITNVINTEAQASYSIRSASVEKEEELKALIQKEVDEFNSKYSKFAQAEVIFTKHLPPFEKADDDLIEKLFAVAAQKSDVTPEISSFHAGAETHIYAQKTNANGEKFLPFLMGTADVFNMHSNSEMVNYKTLLKGYGVLKQLFIEYNS